MTIMNIKKGDLPKTAAAIEKSKERYLTSIGWPEHKRSDLMHRQMIAMASGSIDPKYAAAMPVLGAYQVKLAETLAVNTFNAQLQDYRKASARLARVQLSVGREAQYETRETGEFDPETFEPLTEEVLVSEAVEPESATVEIPICDPETGEITGTEEVPNPAIVKDDEERAAAQAMIDQFTEEQIAEFQTYTGDTNG